MSAETAKRRYDLAEYFFNEEAGQNLDLVEEAILSAFYTDSVNTPYGDALFRYLGGEKVQIANSLFDQQTAGFGRLDEYGLFEFPLPAPFFKKYVVGN
jgi:hypothetical protein